MGKFVSGSAPAAALLLAVALAGCGSVREYFPSFGSSDPAPEPIPAQPAPAPEIPASISSNEIVGRWGYASFHELKDRARTEANARTQCKQPIVIDRGPSGGVMMYPADNSQKQEYFLKGSPAGKNYIGLHGESGQPGDREIVSFDGRVLIWRFVDPEIGGRYGTAVYVRCAPRA